MLITESVCVWVDRCQVSDGSRLQGVQSQNTVTVSQESRESALPVLQDDLGSGDSSTLTSVTILTL